MDNELTLFDRIHVIRDVVEKYGEENFYLSFSGGKDSTVLHYLLDEAIPNNMITRVFVDTGIEYDAIKDFVYGMTKDDKRIEIINPSKNIKQVLDKYGYPFKSKEFSHLLAIYQHGGMMPSVIRYLNGDRGKFQCPNILKPLFTEQFDLKISDKCCLKLKKEPVEKWSKLNNKSICITGMMATEKGLRESIPSCIIKNKWGG
ncbi:phosphoadenosine phosphosulfate reductase domain-containing protein [Amedibacillus sp. YH-ame6]